MPNPNLSEYIIRCKYGPDADSLLDTKIVECLSDDSDQIENRYVYGIVTRTCLTWMYSRIKAVIVQDISNVTYGTNWGINIEWHDAVYGGPINRDLVNEYLVINAVDPAQNIAVSNVIPDTWAAAHIVIIGNY